MARKPTKAHPWPESVSVRAERIFGDYSPFVALAHAIVLQAAEDYMSALDPLAHRDMREWAKDRMIRDVEDFMHSRWYAQLTGVDGDQLLEQLQRHVLEGGTADGRC